MGAGSWWNLRLSNSFHCLRSNCLSHSHFNHFGTYLRPSIPNSKNRAMHDLFAVPTGVSASQPFFARPAKHRPAHSSSEFAFQLFVEIGCPKRQTNQYLQHWFNSSLWYQKNSIAGRSADCSAVAPPALGRSFGCLSAGPGLFSERIGHLIRCARSSG